MTAFSLLGMAAHLKAMERDTEAATQIIVVKAANAIQKKAKSALGTYEFGWPQLKAETIARKKTGDSPLIESGRLRASIEVIVAHHEAWVGSGDSRAVFFEYGTSRMAPRPFISPAAAAALPEIQKIASREMARALEGRGMHANVLSESLHAARELAHIAREIKDEFDHLVRDGQD